MLLLFKRFFIPLVIQGPSKSLGFIFALFIVKKISEIAQNVNIKLLQASFVS